MTVKQWARYKDGWSLFRKFYDFDDKKIKFWKMMAERFSKREAGIGYATTIA